LPDIGNVSHIGPESRAEFIIVRRFLRLEDLLLLPWSTIQRITRSLHLADPTRCPTRFAIRSAVIPLRLSSAFLRFVVGVRRTVAADSLPWLCGRGVSVEIESRLSAHLRDCLGVTTIVSSDEIGPFHETVCGGMCHYQSVRLDQIVRTVFGETVDSDGAAATVTVHGPRRRTRATVAFHDVNRRNGVESYALVAQPGEGAEPCAERISQVLRRAGLRVEVTNFTSHCRSVVNGGHRDKRARPAVALPL